MAAPRKPVGTKSPQTRTSLKPKGAKGGTTTGGGGKKGKKGGKKYKGYDPSSSLSALNPPFDARMRHIGNPTHKAQRMQRGWVQSEDSKRVNFLFNPTQLDVSASVNMDVAQNPDDHPSGDVTSPSYAGLGMSTNVTLLYDRTYEMVSPGNSLAHRFGVWADVAAWYVFFGMLPGMPNGWKGSIIKNPMMVTTGYLFLGPRIVYYGLFNSISVTYSHFSQEMIPVRCAVNVGIDLLPHRDGSVQPISNTSSAYGDQVQKSMVKDINRDLNAVGLPGIY